MVIFTVHSVVYSFAFASFLIKVRSDKTAVLTSLLQNFSFERIPAHTVTYTLRTGTT